MPPKAAPSALTAVAASYELRSPNAAARREASPHPSPSSSSSSQDQEAAAAEGEDPAALRNPHYYDAVHLIVLSHIRRANAAGVLALLSLPQVGGQSDFWRTCTYREGIVASLITYVMEATGYPQVAVEDAWAESIDGEDSGWSTRLSAQLLYALLRCCVPGCVTAMHSYLRGLCHRTRVWAERAVARGGQDVDAYMRLIAFFLRHCGTSASVEAYNTPIPSSPNTFTSAREEMQLYLASVVRRLEGLLSRVADPMAASNEPLPQRRRTETREMTYGDSNVDLRALLAVLQEHSANFVYENPFTSKASLTPTPAPRNVTPPLLQCPPVAAQTLGERAPIPPPPVAASSSSLESVASTSLDAVAMLQRVPALSATRWVVGPASDLAPITTATVPPPSPPPPQRCVSLRVKAEALRETTTPIITAVKQELPQAEATATIGAPTTPPKWMPSPPTLAPIPVPEPEDKRVLAGIHAFDAFTEAMGCLAGQQGTHRAITTTTASALPHHGTHVASPDGPYRQTIIDPLAVDGARATRNLPCTPLAAFRKSSVDASGRVILHRSRFTAAEDAAILHGVARFGQERASFRYILHAYRDIWGKGRDASHLCDHWRCALRRRALEAASAEALVGYEAMAAVAPAAVAETQSEVEDSIHEIP